MRCLGFLLFTVMKMRAGNRRLNDIFTSRLSVLPRFKLSYVLCQSALRCVESMVDQFQVCRCDCARLCRSWSHGSGRPPPRHPLGLSARRCPPDRRYRAAAHWLQQNNQTNQPANQQPINGCFLGPGPGPSPQPKLGGPVSERCKRL